MTTARASAVQRSQAGCQCPLWLLRQVRRMLGHQLGASHHLLLRQVRQMLGHQLGASLHLPWLLRQVRQMLGRQQVASHHLLWSLLEAELFQ